MLSTRSIGVASLAVASLLACSPAAGREPTQLEQYFLELINRARANPNAEVTRLSGEVWGDEGSPATPDLNEGLPAGTITSAPKQPLAFDPRILDAASDYGAFLLATEQFNHDLNGTTRSRIEGKGFPFSGSSGVAENLAINTSTGPNPIGAVLVDSHHEGLFIDGDVPGRGHRTNLMHPSMREIGISVRADSDAQSFFGPPFVSDAVTVQNFVFSGTRVFLTGVIFDDNDSSPNGFFDPGESWGIIDLEIRNDSDSVVRTGRSFASGGYSISMTGLAAGNYTLRAIDSAGTIVDTPFVWNAGNNQKLDLIDPLFFGEPVLVPPFQPDARIGLTSTRQRGNNVINPSGAGQTVARTVRNLRPNRFFATIENDGALEDILRARSNRGNAFFRATYRMQVGGSFINATGSLPRGRAVTLAPEEETRVIATIRATRRAATSRRGFLWRLDALSLGDTRLRDRVLGRLNNRFARR